MSQLQALCDKLGITATSVYGGQLPEGWGRGAHPYKVTLKFGWRRLTTPFFMGAALTEEPSAADVLSCLTSDTRAGRRAEKAWRASVQVAPRVRKFLGEHFDAVASAEH